jgi:uncharacterized membrane protein YbhN (UPF0104 family)
MTPLPAAVVETPPEAPARPGTRLPRSTRRTLAFALRLALTLGLIAVVAMSADWAAMAGRLRDARPLPIALATLVMTLALAAMGVRWSSAMRLFTPALGTRTAVRLTLVGLFLGLALPGGVGGDTVRGWYAYRAGIGLRAIAASLVLDRLVTLFAIFVLIALSLPMLHGALPEAALAQIGGVVVALSAGAAIGLQADRLPLPAGLAARVRASRLAGSLLGLVADLRGALASMRCARPFALATAIHALVTLTTVLLAVGLNLPVTPWECAAVMPVIILGISLPISINGWGVREGTTVAMLAFYGVPAGDALLLSLSLGLVNIAATLPGGLLWLTMRVPGVDTPEAGSAP